MTRSVALWTLVIASVLGVLYAVTWSWWMGVAAFGICLVAGPGILSRPDLPRGCSCCRQCCCAEVES